MNSQAQYEIMKLVVAWTLIGAFVFTVIILLLSLIGLVKFADKRQQNKLFYILIVQLVVGCVGFFKGILQPSPAATVQKIERPLKQETTRLGEENKVLLVARDRLSGELGVATNRIVGLTEITAANQEQLAKANATTEEQREAIEHLQKMTAAAPTAAPDHSEQLDALLRRAEKAEAQLAESEQLNETLNRKVKDNISRMTALEQRKADREAKSLPRRITGRVLSVDADWNFLVLSIGQKQGVGVASAVLIVRNGKQIAEARVTSVEPTKSIADVIASSLLKGVKVQPGDGVVFEGVRNQPIQGTQQTAPTATPAVPSLPTLKN